MHMQYDAVIGAPGNPSWFPPAGDLDSVHFMQLGEKVVQRSGIRARLQALGLIGFFRATSATRIPAAAHHPSAHTRYLIYIRVCPSKMKYSQEHGLPKTQA